MAKPLKINRSKEMCHPKMVRKKLTLASCDERVLDVEIVNKGPNLFVLNG